MPNPSISSEQELVLHYDALVEYISLKFGNRQVALDVVQETYLRVFQKPEQFVNLHSPIAFLKKVSFNIALDYIKKDKNYHKHIEQTQCPIELEDAEPELFSIPELLLMKKQYSELILSQIHQLSPMCQDVFLLIQFHGMTQTEVAEQLGMSRMMVIKHFSKAIKSFSLIFNEE